MPDDWFVVNVSEAPAFRHERCGTSVRFESPEARFPEYGINIRKLQPGQPNGRYHSENVQEDFLVLSGERVAIINGEERALHAWDFLHCPAGTEHIFVGAGNGPCCILMVGARGPDKQLNYKVNDVAARYDASVSAPTSTPREAYADWPSEYTPTQLRWPPA